MALASVNDITVAHAVAAVDIALTDTGCNRRHETIGRITRGADNGRPRRDAGILKLLLTSAGVKNPSIDNALVDLLGKPIAESDALCIPTAMYGHPNVGPGERVWRFISGQEPNCPMIELGWKSVGVLELTALPSIDEQHWVPLVRQTDVLLVAGGDALYLYHWIRESGLADLLPSLSETVWVGLSAGSMVMTPRIGEDFVGWKPPGGGDDTTLGIVDFSICPHLAQEGMPGNSMAEAEQWAAGIPGPAYAMDDETAIKVVDGTVEVVSEGQWKLFTP
ncbi:MAG TPA: Type 1 glutamine amidotransferase-like domain-containing protein [Nocardioidaceae bacterium]|nr:Type 1 glutamine amidotransferase-like domain-containing protein [Nocardioidaceae bacterium]